MTGESTASQNDQREAEKWAMLCHLTALTAFLGIPFGNIIGPLVIWLLKGKDYSFVDEQGKESLNFQISMTIYAVCSALLIFVVVGIILLFAIMMVDVILVIVASVKTNRGEAYRYPLTIRIVK